MLVHVGPKTKEALGVLLDNCHQEGYKESVSGYRATSGWLANATTLETMPAPHLLNIVSAVCACGTGQQAASDPKEAFSLPRVAVYMGREKGAKASLLDLAVVADDTMIGAVMNFKVASDGCYRFNSYRGRQVGRRGAGRRPASQLRARVLEEAR